MRPFDGKTGNGQSEGPAPGHLRLQDRSGIEKRRSAART